MSTLNIPCPHCSRVSRIGSERLPDGPASFPCPGCKGKVVVDKRELLAEQPAPEMTSAEPATSVVPTAPTPPAAEGAPVTAHRRFAKLPAQATFPSGIVVGEDPDTIREVQEKLAALGSEVNIADSLDHARELILNEQPDLCIYVAGEVSAPPFAPVAALTGLPPNYRRRLYLVLVADNLKTLDGNAAFIYQVNMILGKADLQHFGEALYSGIDYHNRLYASYLRAAEKQGSI